MRPLNFLNKFYLMIYISVQLKKHHKWNFLFLLNIKISLDNFFILAYFLLWTSGLTNDLVPSPYWRVGGADLYCWLSLCCIQHKGDPTGKHIPTWISGQMTIKKFQMYAVNYHESRPDYLIYLDHSFHVFDIQVIL